MKRILILSVLVITAVFGYMFFNKKKVVHADWHEGLTAEEYHVLVENGTEQSGSSPLNEEKRVGTYVTAGCGLPVFRSEDKFESGTGWPSFTKAIEENIELVQDYKLIVPRTEVRSKCGEHLGHVFNDGPKEAGGKRWCMNGVALRFIPDEIQPNENNR